MGKIDLSVTISRANIPRKTFKADIRPSSSGLARSSASSWVLAEPTRGHHIRGRARGIAYLARIRRAAILCPRARGHRIPKMCQRPQFWLAVLWRWFLYVQVGEKKRIQRPSSFVRRPPVPLQAWAKEMDRNGNLRNPAVKRARRGNKCMTAA